MAALAHDEDAAVRTGVAPGLGLAVISAVSFGLSGPLAKAMLESGWTPAAAVTARILVAALALAPPALVALRGRWGLLRQHLGLLASYGGIAIAGCQLAYFSAAQHMQVGVALLIEYTAPVAVVGWMWLRHGHRPGRLTVAGAVVSAIGLVLVLDVIAGAHLSVVGVLWALAAMGCVSTYFVLSAQNDTGLPPIVLAAGGLAVGAAGLLVAGLVGVVPLAATTRPVTYQVGTVSWWVPVLALGLVGAAVAYVAGIAASRLLGSRLASFVGLLEVLAALAFAWLLLAEVPRPIQLLGGLLVLAGVLVVKLGEGEPAPEHGPLSTGRGSHEQRPVSS